MGPGGAPSGGARPGLLLVLVLAAAQPVAAQRTVPFTPGMQVTESVRIAPGTYRAEAPDDTTRALITVRGDAITLDLRGVRLEGMDPETDPDLARGIAVRVMGGRDVTLRGGAIRGYRFGVVASGVRGLQILEGDFSYNWKPRLFSQVGHESLVDWLSYHDNESRNWMRFGAAVYLEDVTGGLIQGNRAVQGMNGLLMTRTDSVRVRDNDFSYNSGLGLGLYRSSHNVVVRNRFDYDVRGYSEGFYQRGQDSAGILVYEQSGHNVFAYNSATHSGDGFFLWAGNSTMESGQGGANDNLLFQNDFSYAPTNAVEVTFSRNRIVANQLRGSRYGVWGGYSWETLIRGNCFGGNQYGVAIEHGQDNRIVQNHFRADSPAVSLWARESQPPDWGYPRHRDVRSRNHVVEGNVFTAVAEVWRLERTEALTAGGNRVADPSHLLCDPRELMGASAFDSVAAEVPAGLREIPASPRGRLPRSAIVVDEWGPWDGRSPKLWPTDTTRVEVPLAVLGPPGRWRVTSRRGVARLTAESGATGDTLGVTPSPGAEGDWRVELEYVGEATVSPRGAEAAAGMPVAFAFERFQPGGPWTMRFHTWEDPAEDPHVNPEAFAELLAGDPAFVRTEDRLDYQWYRPLVEGVPQERWAVEATGQVDLPAGSYSLRTISDDAITVWVDGERVIHRQEPGGSLVHYADMPPGRHDVRVVYYQLGGWAEMRLDVVKGSARSPGSAGPH